MMIVSPHPHVCGARDLKGFNDKDYSNEKCIKDVIDQMPTYSRPYKGKLKSIGTGYFTVCASSHDIWEKKTDRYFNNLRNFQRFVRRHKLGTVRLAPMCENPNYAGGHIMLPGMFIPNNQAIREYGIKKGWIEKDAGMKGTNSELYAMWSRNYLDRVEG